MSDAKEKPAEENDSVEIIFDRPPTSFMETLVHLFKGSIGVGLFAMGDAFKNGGIYVSSAFILFLAIICIHCQHVLLSCTDIIIREYHEDGKRINYAQAVELCVANGPKRVAATSGKFRVLCNFLILFTQLGFCCIYLVFIAKNIEQILVLHNVNINIHILIFIVWVPIVLVCLIPNLKALAPVSLVANIFFIASFVLAIYFAVKDGLPSVTERRPYTDFHHLALFVCTAIYSYEGIALLLPIKNEMQNPPDFDKPLGVLNIGMSFVVLMYFICGFCGYLKWGEEVGGSITLNIGDSILAQCTKSFVSIAIMLTYPLMFYVPIEALTPKVLRRFKCHKKPLACELIFRALLSASTLVIALAFPNIGLFISLVGGMCSTALALIFPTVLESVLLYRLIDNPMWLKVLKIMKNFFILVFALITCFYGTYVSFVEIVKFYKREYNLQSPGHMGAGNSTKGV